MDCWDFVFSFVKNHIDALVQQADKYTKEMNEDYEHFFCWYAEEDVQNTTRACLLPRFENGFIRWQS